MYLPQFPPVAMKDWGEIDCSPQALCRARHPSTINGRNLCHSSQRMCYLKIKNESAYQVEHPRLHFLTR